LLKQMKFKNILIFLVICLAFLNNLFWTAVIPYNEAPDEYTHFQVAQFIAQKNRFPVFGQDENMGVSKYEKPGFRAFYNASYSCMPPLAYLFQASAIKIIPGLKPDQTYLAARLSSVFLGLVFSLIILKLARLLFPKFSQQLTFMIFTLFIPQATFIFSYVNSDALSLVLSSLLFYYVIFFLKGKNELNLATSLVLGLILGLTALTRYNAFVLFPFVGLVFLGRVKREKKELVGVGLTLLASLLVSGWWYGRNLLIYGDLLAMKQFWQTYRMLYPPEDIGHQFYTLGYILFQTGWLGQTFRSFWASFGWNYILLPENIYRLLALVCLWSIYGLFKEFKRERQFLAFSGLIFFASLSLSLWQSLKFGFQAQGRYLFPALPAVSFILVFGLFNLSRKKWAQGLAFLLVNLGIIFLNIFSLVAFLIPAYY